MAVYTDTLRLRGSPLEGDNPQPFFRDPAPDLPTASGAGFPERARASFGRETAFRILPYTRQDRYGRELRDLELPVIVMENDFLKAQFIPSLGGRLWSLFDKKQNRDVVYRNPVFRPANLAIRDAWFSGGVEWNIGRLGHGAHTCAPVFAGILPSGEQALSESQQTLSESQQTLRESQPVLRLWEFERQTRLFWRVECTLPEDSPALYVYVRIENPDPDRKPLYWWTNAALPQTEGTAPGDFPVRVLSASGEVLYIIPGTGGVKTMGGCRLPELPTLPGADASYPVNSDYSNEYFFQNDAPEGPAGRYPWESAVYGDGYAYGEASTAPLLYRKMFCWGSGRGGRRWQDFLSLPGEQYLEVQAGLARTQLHTADIDGGGVTDWVQGFTALRVDPHRAHQRDYRAAAEYMEERLKAVISPGGLDKALEAARQRAGVRAEPLFLGGGWGALERTRAGAIPPGLSFPDESIGAEEKPWAELLRTGALPPRRVEAGPGVFAGPEWEAPLERSFTRNASERDGKPPDWLSPYHLGVIAFERGETERAVSYWKQSAAGEENAWAFRNLAAAALRRGKAEAALGYYKKAFNRPEGKLDPSFAEEYIPLLLERGLTEEAARELDAYREASGSYADEALPGPLLDAAARLALARGDDAALDRIFAAEPAHIREGNTTLVDIWAAREIRRLTGGGMDQAEAEARIREALAAGELEPPREIDFRMYTRPAAD
jgi:tetratricopeptide (TPR) repeat protein